MEINNYIGFKAINTTSSTTAGKVGLISDFVSVRANKDHILQFKIIDMLGVPTLNWMYIVYDDGTEQKLPDINIESFETINTLQGKSEKLCHVKFKPTSSGRGRFVISRKQTVKDINDSIAFLIREIDLKEGSNLTDFSTNTLEDAQQSLYLFSQIQQLAGEINMKVGRNDVISSINMSPEKIKLSSKKIELFAEDVRVAWNNINDSMSLRSDELAMFGGSNQGKRLSLKRGLLNTYRDTDNGFLGYYGMDRTYGQYYGTTNLGSYYSWFYGIAQDLGMDHDSDISENKKYYMYVSFADHEAYKKGTHFMEGDVHIWQNVQMRNHNLYDIGNCYFSETTWSRVSKMSNQGLLLEGDPELQIGLRLGGKFDVALQLINSHLYDMFSYKHLDMQGRVIKNSSIQASSNVIFDNPVTIPLSENESNSVIDNINFISSFDLESSEIIDASRIVNSDAVVETEDGSKILDTNALVIELIKEVKQLKLEIAALKSQE